ncbi:hypothetical protein, partial [Thermomonas sp.]|uniref:hypothetical protein n=1 Tax=Thermomonas sp. TaxID=1971895 RepID=UPI002CAC0C19
MKGLFGSGSRARLHLSLPSHTPSSGVTPWRKSTSFIKCVTDSIQQHHFSSNTSKMEIRRHMNDIRNVTRTNAHTRTIKQSAMARAVRSVLAASALTLALGATSGTAAAATHKVPVAHALLLQRAAIDFAAVQDLSLVPQQQGVVATVNPSAIPPVVQPGDIVINNPDGSPITDSGAWSINIQAISTGPSGTQPGDVTITNGAGSNLTANSTSGSAYNIFADAYADLSITNVSDLTTVNTGAGWAVGIVGKAANGSITVDNDGDISATAVNWAYGMHLNSGAGGVTVTNDGDITATSSSLVAMGIKSKSDGDTFITNTGDITVNGLTLGAGLYALGTGDVSIENHGAIDAFSLFGPAVGLNAVSYAGATTITNDATISTNAFSYTQGIYAYADGAVSVTNSGAIDTYAFGGVSQGIFAYSVAATVVIDNSGDIDSYSLGGDATAIHGYSL